MISKQLDLVVYLKKLMAIELALKVIFKAPERYLLLNQRYFTVSEKIVSNRDSYSNSDEFNLSDSYDFDGQRNLKLLLEGVHNGRRIHQRAKHKEI